MAFNGWFPHFSPSGVNLLTGTAELWINKTQNLGFGYQGVPSASRGWFNETTVLYLSTAADGSYGLWSCTVGGTRKALGIPASFYQFAVASGRWAGWDGAIKTSWGQTISADNPRSPAVSRSHFAYLLDTNTSSQRLILDGTTLVSGSGITDPQMSEQGLCWVKWVTGGYEMWGVRLDISDTPANVSASSEQEYQAIPIDTPSGPWILSYDSSRLLLRPWGSTTGYVVATGETMYPMAVWHTATGTFRVGWSSSAGVYAETYIDPADTRVALGGTTTPPAPGEVLPGNPGATQAAKAAAQMPPLRHPLVDEKTGLVTEPWAAWFEAQAMAEATNPYAYVPANTLIGRGGQGPGPASVLAIGSGLTIRDDTLLLE